MMEKKTIILSNSTLECELCNDGASIMRLMMKCQSGMKKDLILALDPALYPFDPSYSGATLGPSVGRVRGGRFWLDGKEYQLNQNDGNNTLHGGDHGLSHQRFAFGNLERKFDSESLTFTICLDDGVDGWPGNRKITVRYTVGPGAILTIEYGAHTDKPTWLDCSSHIYWNLNSHFSSPATEHKLRINADRVVLNNAQHLPVSVINVEGTPYDFREAISICKMMKKFDGHDQLLIAKGYNNTFLLNDNILPAVEVESIPEGVDMKLYTDQPCVVFYSGGFLGDSKMRDGSILTPSCALAFEAQNYPDLPNSFPSQFIPLRPGESFSRYIKFELSEANE